MLCCWQASERPDCAGDQGRATIPAQRRDEAEPRLLEARSGWSASEALERLRLAGSARRRVTAAGCRAHYFGGKDGLSWRWPAHVIDTSAAPEAQREPPPGLERLLGLAAF